MKKNICTVARHLRLGFWIVADDVVRLHSAASTKSYNRFPAKHSEFCVIEFGFFLFF